MQQESEVRRPFRMCPACGRLTPSNNPSCVECGEGSVRALAEQIEHENEQRFARRFFGHGTPATWALIGANVAVFVLMAIVAKTVNPGTPQYQDALVDFGAKVNELIGKGEYWRFVTPMFIHIGAMHLLVNMYSLYMIGPPVERLYGTARFLVMYVLSGIGGVACSYLTISSDAPSAGASGALFGLLGILLVFGLRWNHELPGVFRQAFSPRQFVPVLVLNLLITFFLPFIDKGAHIGGLLVGGALAAVVPYRRGDDRARDIAWWVAAAICIVVVVASFGMAFRTFGVPRGANETARRLTEFVTNYNAMDAALTEARGAIDKAADGQAIPVDAAARAASAAQLGRQSQGLDTASSRLMTVEVSLLDRAATLLADPTRRPTPEQAKAFDADAAQLEKDWDGWLETSGEAFGLTKQQDTQ